GWLGVVGCAAGILVAIIAVLNWRERREVEGLVREQYQQQTNQTVTSVSLSRQSDGKFTGPLVTADGEELLVTATVTKNRQGRWISWVAQVPVERKEELVRRDLERNNQPVRSVELRLDEKGLYSGRIVLNNGDELDVRDVEAPGGGLLTRYEYTLTTAEKW